MARRPTPWFRKARNAWFVTIGGIQHNLGPDKKLAFEKFHKLMAQERTEKVLGESFAALADRYLEWVHKKRSPDTYEWYRYRIERFVQRHPNLLAAEVRPHHIEDWTDSYDLTVTSKRNYMRSVKRCLSWAIKQGFLKENPLSALEIPSGDHKEIVFTQAEVENLLSYVRSPALMDLIVTTIETGCRPQESLRVEARHVDLQNKRWVIPKKESKMKRMARIVYLNEKAFEITKRLVEKYPTGKLFRNTNDVSWTTEAVNCAFQNIRIRMCKDEIKRRGIEITAEEIEEKIKTLNPIRISKGKVKVEKSITDLKVEAKHKLIAGLMPTLVPPYCLYALRHSWATNALFKGVDPLTVAILMGHEDPSMLCKVYQHMALNPKHMLSEAERARK